MSSRHTYKNLTWVDLESPRPEEVRAVMSEFDLHPLVAEELLTPSLRPKAEHYGNCLYVILHFPLTAGGKDVGVREIDFVIGKHFIITTRYESLDPIHAFTRAFEASAVLGHHDLGEHAGYIFYYMVRNLYRAEEEEMEAIGKRLRTAEERIFGGHEKEMVSELSQVSRTVLVFKDALQSHREVLASLADLGRRFFGDSFAHHLRRIEGEYFRASASLAREREFLTELRETNNSLLTIKQNEVMKILTIMAFVTFPLSLISSIFGMNTEYLPIVGLPGDFWFVIGGMATLTLFFFVFFKRKHWL